MAGGKMNPLKLNLIICLCGTVLWILLTVFHAVIIIRAKKTAPDKECIAKAPSSYWCVIVSSAAVVVLPYLILFQPYVTAVLEGCAIMGTWAVMKERFEKIAGGKQ